MQQDRGAPIFIKDKCVGVLVSPNERDLQAVGAGILTVPNFTQRSESSQCPYINEVPEDSEVPEYTEVSEDTE